MAEVEQRIELILPSPRKLFTPAVTIMIALMVIGYALIHHAKEFTLGYLALNPQTFLPLRLWQLVTYSLIDVSSWNLVFDLVVVLFLGSAIEREWRSRSLLMLLLTVSVTCGAVWVLVNLVAGWNYIGIGTGACAYGLIAAFGLVFRRKRFFGFFWTLEAQYLALLLIGIGLVIGIARPITWIWIGGAAVAYVYIKLRWRIASGAAGRSTRAARTRPGSFVDID
jgi:membrane associated rhomboid family serine protease